MTKYLDESNLIEQVFVWAHGCKPHSILVGKLRWQEPEAADPSACRVGKQREAHACACSFSPSGSVQGPSTGRGATHSGLGRPNAISLFQIILHRQAQMLFSQVILDLIKLTIHTKHHNTQRKKIMEAVYTNMRTSIVTSPWCNFSNEYVLLLY